MRTVVKCPGSANTSSSAPRGSAGQCSPRGSGGRWHSALARARTRAASVVVSARGRISRGWLAVSLTSSWTNRRLAAHSGTPADARAAAALAVAGPAAAR